MCKKYKLEEAKVFIMSNDEPSLQRSIAEPGEDHGFAFGDVSVSADVEAAIQQALNKYGKIDVIHNNAGIAHPSKPLHETTEAEWQMIFDIDLKSILYTCKFGLDSLKKTFGCIINTSSLVGDIGQSDHAAYAASKGTMNTLTKCMALDYAPYKIRVNAVAPAAVLTDMLREWARDQKNNSMIEKYLDEIYPLRYCPGGYCSGRLCIPGIRYVQIHYRLYFAGERRCRAGIQEKLILCTAHSL